MKIGDTKRSASIFLIVHLMLSIFAFAFMFSQIGMVSGGAVTEEPLGPPGEGVVGPPKVSNYIEPPKAPTMTNVLSNDPAPELYPLDVGGGTTGAITAAKGAQLTSEIGGKFGGQITSVVDGSGKTLSVSSMNAQGMTIIGKDGTRSFIPADKMGDYKIGDLSSANAGSKGFFSKLFSPQEGTMGLLQAAGWAITAYMVVGFLGNMFGLQNGTTQALQYSSAAGVATFYGLSAYKTALPNWLGANIGIVSIGVALAVFVLTYKETSYKTVSFECMPWQAPIGGNDCQKCNDGIHPCDEYRCKSLGQACQIVNKGSDKELCVWVNPQDVNSPAITPLNSVLSAGLKYTNTQSRPPAWGTQLTTTNGDCIPAFTPITFGISTDKPAQCKIDFSLNASGKFTAAYDQMNYYFGETNMFDYNHSQTMNLPGPDAVNAEAASKANSTGGLLIQNDGRYQLYVRCISANGFFNQDPYVIKFCVDKGPDLTPPVIVQTSISNNQPVQYQVDTVPIITYTNEPATCRWSRTNLRYDQMENNMSCATSISQMSTNNLYACSGNLTAIKDRADNVFYFRCLDQPWKPQDQRIPMTESYVLTLKGTQPLNIDQNSIYPKNGTIKGATSTINISLQLKTQNGYNDGQAICYYSAGNQNNYIEFANTNSDTHSQSQDLGSGNYNYFFKCVDLGGNTDYGNASFSVVIDKTAPQVVRVLYDSNKLEILTNKDATCVYSTNDNTQCNYNMGDPNVNTMVHETSNVLTQHFAAWTLNQNYYIKCKDTNGIEPNPTQCSVVVRPVDIAGSGQ